MRRHLAHLSLALSLITAALWTWGATGIHQVARATPEHAAGIVVWNASIHFYAADRYDGTFARDGTLVTGPIDVALDPDSRWGYGFALGHNMVGVHFSDALHGADWTGIELPLDTFTLIFALYPISRPLDAAIARFKRRLRIRRRARRRPCVVCGYNLFGNESGICPECGTAIKALASRRA